MYDTQVLAEHARNGNCVLATAAIEGERSLESGERELVRSERTLEWMMPQALDQVGAADHDPRLRSAEQLVSRETNEMCTSVEARARARLVLELVEEARAKVVDQHEAAPLCERRELAEARLCREADHPEVRLVHPEDRGCRLLDRVLVVGDPRAVRRADLDELRAGAHEDVRNSEPIADLDQLAA